MLPRGTTRAWSAGAIAACLAAAPGFCAQTAHPSETPATAAATAEARQLQAARRVQADLVLQVLLTAQLLNDSARAQWAAPLRKVRRKAKRKAGPVIEDLATDGDVGFVFAADLSSAEGFSYDEEGADAQPTPDSGVDAVASEIEASSTPEPLFVEAPVAEPADAETTTDMEAAEADDLSAEPTDDLPATASEEEGDG